MVVKKIYSFLIAGASEGTSAQGYAEKLNFEILSVGNLCRQQVLLKQTLVKKIQESLDFDFLIFDELLVNLFIDRVFSKKNAEQTLILDGLSRIILQVKFFNNFLNRFYQIFSF